MRCAFKPRPLNPVSRHPALRSLWLVLVLSATFCTAIHASATLSVWPEFASVHTNATAQFAATLTGSTAAETWLINGIPGGNSAVGTVSTNGLYTAPSAVPTGTTVMLTASAAGADPFNVVVAISTGASFYVSTNGNDTAVGTSASPWKTIQHAANTAIAGDTVYVEAGTYNESINLPNSGSPTAGSIIFRNYPGQAAIVSGTGVPCCGSSVQGLFNITGNQSYLILYGFQIENYTSNNVNNVPAGIYVSGSGRYIQIVNSTVHGITETAGAGGNAHGIGFYGTAAAPLSNITLMGNNVYGMVTGNSETITIEGNVDGFSVVGNSVHDNNNIGIDATGFYGTGPAGSDQARNGVISGNTVYNITSLHNPAYNGLGADGIYCDGCTAVTIERNLVYACDLNIEAASENAGRYSTYVTIANNVVYGGNLAGISIGAYASTVGGSQNIAIVNNTLFENNTTGGGGDFQIQYHASSNLFENNIVYAGSYGVMVNGIVDSTARPVKLDYNLYYTTASHNFYWQGAEYNTFMVYRDVSTQDAHSLFLNPDFQPQNYDVTAASPARNAGNFTLGSADYGTLDFAGNPRTTGSTINIGAYQQ